MEIRELCEADVEIVCRHRAEMFREAGIAADVLETMTNHFREWLRPQIRDGSYFGFFADDGDAVVAGIGLMLIDWPPHPSHPTECKRGYVLNLYVEPTHRRRGLGRQLMAIAESEFLRRGIAFAILHATEQGRPMYAARGWNGTTEMAKHIVQ